MATYGHSYQRLATSWFGTGTKAQLRRTTSFEPTSNVAANPATVAEGVSCVSATDTAALVVVVYA